MSSWLEAKVIENRRWTEALFSLRVALAEGAPRLAFEAGRIPRRLYASASTSGEGMIEA